MSSPPRRAPGLPGEALGGLEAAGTTEEARGQSLGSGISISPELEDVLQEDAGKAVPLVVAVDVAVRQEIRYEGLP